MSKIICFFCIYLVAFNVSAQQFGGNPPYYKWKRITTDTVRIVYREGLDSIAAQIAAVAHHEARVTAFTIGNRLKPIDIVLQDAPTYSNAFVQLAPRRSEFFLTPLQNNFSLGITPWHKTLAIHEYRHVMQYDNFNKGLARVAGVILGQQGQLLLANAAVPGWFWEGEATFYETALSQNGRGRIPFFFNQYKSLWAANRDYNFMKLRNGSLKHFVPSDYHFGYNMVVYGLDKYGLDFWKKVTEDAVRFKGLFYPFQQAVKRHSGISYKQFYAEAQNHIRAKSSLTTMDSAEVMLANPANNNVKDYYSPHFIDEKTLIVYKRQYKKLPGFYYVRGSKEELITIADVLTDEYFHYNNGKIVYAAFRPDKRWSYHTYSEIKVMDISTRKDKRLTTRGKYFSPSLSPDNSRIVAVHVPPSQKVRLHIIDASNGSLVSEVPNPASYFYTYPRFLDSNSLVVALRDTAGRMAIARVIIATGTTEFLTPLSNTVVSSPYVVGNMVYFNASANNADNIFAVDATNKQVFQLTHTSLGNYQPHVFDNRLVYNKRTADGFLPATQPVNMQLLPQQAVDNILQLQNPYVPSLLNRFADSTIAKIQPLVGLDVQDYSKLSGFMGFHSWRPFYEPPEFTFTVYGQNLLNTSLTQLQYTYNENEGSHQLALNKLIGIWYPFLTGGLSYTLNRSALLNNGQLLTWDVFNANAGFIIPFNFSRGKQFSSLQFGTTYNFENISGVSLKNIRGLDPVNYLNSFLSFRIQSQQAVQHINPKWALSITARYRNSVNKTNEATQFFASASVNTPAFAPTHNFTFSGAYQQIDTFNFPIFSNNLPFARGYNFVPYARLLPKMYRGSVNYHLPLFYPDWGFANLVYFKRVRTALFYDHAVAEAAINNLRFDFRSAGSELWFDVRFWNEYDMSVGIRYSRLLDNEISGITNPNQWEVMFPLTFLD